MYTRTLTQACVKSYKKQPQNLQNSEASESSFSLSNSKQKVQFSEQVYTSQAVP